MQAKLQQIEMGPAEPATQDFDTRTAVNEYGFYCVPVAYVGREVPAALLKAQVYEPRTLRLMRLYVRDGDIISGGAFIGDFLPALSDALAPGATLHSFEPIPLSYAAACNTVRLNGLTNVSLSQVAVGADTGTLHMQVVDDNGEPMAARAKVIGSAIADRTVQIPVVPLDELVDRSRRVSVLHLDVEGHEAQALTGAQRIITECRPLIVLEAAKSWAQRDYEAKLNEAFPGLGYRFSGAMERNAFYIADG